MWRRFCWLGGIGFLASLGLAPGLGAEGPERVGAEPPFLRVLGVAQDAGIPQAGSHGSPAWTDPDLRRLATSLGLVDPASGARWIFDATPDFKEQWYRLAEDPAAPSRGTPDGIFLTHAHIGHYTGLMMLGHEVMGARRVPVYAMPKMRRFLETNGPWDQLVRYENIELRSLEAGRPVELTESLRVTPILVPHRQEYSEVVGFRIEGPTRSALFLPDIDRWEDWDLDLAEILASVDTAYLDGTFFSDGEIPGRDMSGFPHPWITTTMRRLESLPAEEKGKVRFIHFNHTNPVSRPDSEAARRVERAGFRLAREGEVFDL